MKSCSDKALSVIVLASLPSSLSSGMLEVLLGGAVRLPMGGGLNPNTVTS